MRIHASGTGRTLDEAMEKVTRELATAALHVAELKPREIGGVKVLDPEQARVASRGAADLERMARELGRHIQPADGCLYRVLASVSDDGVDSHGKVEVDLIRA
jgi:hypothetical protein